MYQPKFINAKLRNVQHCTLGMEAITQAMLRLNTRRREHEVRAFALFCCTCLKSCWTNTVCAVLNVLYRSQSFLLCVLIEIIMLVTVTVRLLNVYLTETPKQVFHPPAQCW